MIIKLPFRMFSPLRRGTTVIRETETYRRRNLTATRVRTTVVTAAPPPQRIVGTCWVIDGDTIVINDTRIRLFGIDAPEMDHPLGKKAKWELVALCQGRRITAHPDGSLSHDRLVARCYLEDGTDLSAEMVRRGMAIDWARYSGGACRTLEPEGIRTRRWHAHARQGRAGQDVTIPYPGSRGSDPTPRDHAPRQTAHRAKVR